MSTYIMFQTVHCLPCLLPEKFEVGHLEGLIDFLKCFENCFGRLESIGRSVAKNQGNSDDVVGHRGHVMQ